MSIAFNIFVICISNLYDIAKQCVDIYILYLTSNPFVEEFEPSLNYDDNLISRYLIDLHNKDHQVTSPAHKRVYIDHNAHLHKSHHTTHHQPEQDLVISNSIVCLDYQKI